MDAGLLQRVRLRANEACEYCRMPARLYDQPFHTDHIIARKHGGPSEFDNLAFCCLDCNLHKGTNIAGLDPMSGRMSRLFHPRSDRWDEHFTWNGPELSGLTEVGRTTVAVLDINQPIRVRARALLIADGALRLD